MAYYRRYRSSPSRRRSGGRRYGSRRQPLWIRQFESAAADIPNVGFDLLPDDAVDPGAKLGATVVRIRGELAIMSTGNPYENSFTVGIAVAEREADYNAPVLNPATDANTVDWLYWESWIAPGDSTLAVQATGQVYHSRHVDAKSSRRIYAPGQTLALYVAVDTTPAQHLGPRWSGSVLLKLA